MKSLLTSALTFLACFSLWAQAPESVNYQAVARNNSGDLITNTNLNVRFTIRSGSAGGASVYQETHFANTNDYGLFTAAIGNGTPVSGTFASINWSSNSYFLQVEVNPGSGYVDLGATQLLSVPYALHAKSVSGGLTGTGTQNRLAKFTSGTAIGNSTLFDNGTNVGVGTTNPLKQFTVGGPTSAIMVGFSGSFNNVESGRLIFNEDIAYASGTCGFEFAHNGAANDLTLLGGCPTMDTIVRYTRSGSSYFNGNARFGSATQTPSNPVSVAGNADISGRLGIAVTIPAADMHMKMSGGISATGGIRFEGATNTNYWQIGSASTNNFWFAYNGTLASFITTTGTYTVSDRRMKENLVPVENTLARIMQMQVYRYNYTNQSNSGSTIGVVAQEVQSLFPELVGEEDGTLGVNYGSMGVIAIKAIQEQQAEIDALKEKVEKMEELQREMEELREMVRALSR